MYHLHISFLTNQLLNSTFSAFGEKGKFLVSGGNDASVKIWDWSKGFSSETNSNAELVLDIDVKKKVRTGSSILYARFKNKIYLLQFKKMSS